MLTPCVVCGHLITEQHHLIPRAYGGSDDPANLVALCPNHHTAFHIVFRRYEWEFMRQGMWEVSKREIEPLPLRHQHLYAAVYQDAALVEFFRSEFMPRFEAAGYPFNVPQQRKTFALMAEIATERALHQEQTAWNARKGQKAAQA